MSLRLKHLFRRISKDHTASASSQNAAGGGSKSSSSAAPEGGKKKGVYAVPELPPVKEKSKSKLKKMAASVLASDIAEEPSNASVSSRSGEEVPFAQEDFGYSSGGHREGMPERMAVDPPSEKSNLERMVSDLIKNSESKKQEIAALKMEINRLKVRSFFLFCFCFGGLLYLGFALYFGNKLFHYRRKGLGC